MTKKEKQKVEQVDAVSEALTRIREKYGNTIMMSNFKDNEFNVESIPTGCPGLDDVFGCGGLPRGRIIEVFGQESSGKSTLTTFLIAQIQKNGGRAALIDAECAYDPFYAKNIGVDTSKIIVSQPESLEEGFDVLRELVETGMFDIIVIDSVAALTPKSEIESDEMLKDSMAVQARLIGKALRILTGPISRSKTTVIFINQLREKIGVFFGNKDTTPGGKALKFFSSVRLDVKRGDKIEEGGKQIGNWLKITAVKNKVGFPWGKTEFELYFSKGIDLYGANLDYGLEKGVVEKIGNTYSFKGQKIGVGRDQVKNFLKLPENKKTFDELLKEIQDLTKLRQTI